MLSTAVTPFCQSSCSCRDRTDGRVLRIDQGSMPADLGFVVIQMVRNIKPFGSIADILVLSEYPLIPLWPKASYTFSP